MLKVVKWIFRILICVVVLYLIVGVTWNCIATRGANPPSVEDAPWVIQTYSNDEVRVPGRVYYASDVEILPDNTPVAKNPYWSYDGAKYHKVKEDRVFPVLEYGNVGIERRVK